MTIRNATLKDLEIVHEIETVSFTKGSYPLFVLRQMFDISEEYFFVAEVDGEIWGYILGNLSGKDAQGWILSLGVHPRARGKQLGKALTKKLIALLEHNNSKEICLTVHPDNASAIKIYEDLDFEFIIEHANYYLDGEARLLMKKKAITNRINA